MKMIEDFGQFYSNTLLPDLKTLEIERKSVQNQIYILAFVTLVLAGIIYKVDILCEDGISLWGTLSLAGLISLAAIRYKSILSSYGLDFRSKIIRKLISYINPDMQYSPEEYISPDIFKQFGLCPIWTEQNGFLYTGQDYARGKIGLTQIEFSQISAGLVTYKAETRKQIYLKGICFVADFNKEFSGKTIVIVKDIAGCSLDKIAFEWGGKPVLLENPKFLQEFNVYSTDQVEARYILTPAFAEKILYYRWKHGYPFCLAFVENKLFALFPGMMDVFMPKLFGNISDFKDVEKYYRKFELILCIAEELNLNAQIRATS